MLYKVLYMSEMPVTPEVTEQRKSERSSIRRCGWFTKMKGAQLRECVVLDESESGARLAVDDSNELPDKFYVYMSLEFRSRQHCHVIWRLNGQVGVKYQD